MESTYFFVGVLWRVLLVAAVWNFGGFNVKARAQDAAREYDVKAAFLTKFRGYVKGASGASLGAIGVLGDDPFGGAFKRGKRVEDLKGCQIVFVSKSERANLGGILSSLGGGVLTVGDFDGFAKQGGMIGFVLEGDRVRFEIHNGAAKRAGLAIDSQLLQRALHVFN